MKNGTPSQRQLSISSRSATNVSVVESGATPSTSQVAVVLAAHVAARVGRGHRAEDVDLAVAHRVGSSGAARGRLHRDQREDLQQVVLDDVAQRADRVVEAAAVLDAEVLGHRDLHASRRSGGSTPARGSRWRTAGRGCPSPAPCRGSGRCGRSALRSRTSCSSALSCARRLEVVAERLLDHDPRALGQPGARQAAARPRRTATAGSRGRRRRPWRRRSPRRAARRCRPRCSRRRRRRCGPAAASSTSSSTSSTVVVDRLRRARGRSSSVQWFARDADDPAVELAAALEPVERLEGHLLRQIAGDPEDDEGVRARLPGDLAAAYEAALGPPRMRRITGACSSEWSDWAGWARTSSAA